MLYADCLGATINDTALAAELFSYVKDLLGPEQTDVIGPIMGAEDFSEVSSRVPTVYMDLSFGSIKEGYPHRVHSPYFRINEEALPVGARLLCGVRHAVFGNPREEGGGFRLLNAGSFSTKKGAGGFFVLLAPLLFPSC